MRAIKVHTFQKEKYTLVFGAFILGFTLLAGRLCYLMIFRSEELSKKALNIEQRERTIKAARGKIYDRNGIVLADNQAVCSVSVIYYQIKEPQKVIKLLSQKLALSEEEVKKKVEKVSSREKIKSNVPKSVADEIREAGLDGVKVDEDYKRYYPYSKLCSKVLGFTGSDNQGILGLEAKYDAYLSGTPGQILTLTDAWGVEVKNGNEERDEPEKGSNLYTSIDINIQSYAQQLAQKTLEQKQAKSVSIIVMNPENGEILAMTNEPEYDLNNPYELNSDLLISSTGTSKMDLLNNMWRNFCINDTYEPGSIFKMVTATAALETGSVTLNDHFTCGGSAIVADRKIRCHKTTGHGTQTFTQTVMNSCNPAFIEWGRRVGTERFFEYMGKLGLLEKTGIDIAGEASTIIHKQENVGEVELVARMSFGQSFQITPLQMLRAASAIINGGNLVTPHFAVKSVSEADGTAVEFNYEIQSNAIEEKTSLMMKDILRQVVEEGGGKKAYLEGFSIGGKTATSQKLPRGSGKYISSFIGFSPVDNAKVIAMCLIDEPQGIYYGGTIAAPVIRELFENILPYLEIQNN